MKIMFWLQITYRITRLFVDSTGYELLFCNLLCVTIELIEGVAIISAFQQNLSIATVFYSNLFRAFCILHRNMWLDMILSHHKTSFAKTL